ncbi:membrane protein [Ectopseudomonas oleovorans]|nr:membrane protein [Pseudomonas oleovorans]KJU77811.1 membrane protein [Pseudomonas oleovorans]
MEVCMAVEIIVLGVGPTLLMDLWALARKRWFGVAALDYAWVGRWLGHMRHGQFRHAAIGQAPTLRGERALGWGVHYLTGLIFAALFLVWVGEAWLQRPTLVPALAFGALSVVAPLLLMQPAFGMGVAASRTPRPWQVRVRALLTHLVFGLGLYLMGLLAQWL